MKLPFRDESFDILTSFGVIEHFRSEKEVIQALSESRRVLKTGGRLMLIIPNFAATFRNKLVIALSKGRFGMYHKPLTKSVLIKFFYAIRGWRIIERGNLPFGHYNIILEIFEKRSIEKTIYFLYHTAWRTFNFLLKILAREDYQNPIYIVAEKNP